VGWSRDDRDSALAPNSGRYQRLNSEWSVAGDARYVRANYQYQQYIPLTSALPWPSTAKRALARA
jgi:Outer membrane protein/protective antigen OMA87